MKMNKSLAIIICLFSLFLSACTFGVKGMPVKKYLESSESQPLEEQRIMKDMTEEIINMGRVTENSVFTEKRGVPEYRIGPDDILTIKFMKGQDTTERDVYYGERIYG